MQGQQTTIPQWGRGMHASTALAGLLSWSHNSLKESNDVTVSSRSQPCATGRCAMLCPFCPVSIMLCRIILGC